MQYPKNDVTPWKIALVGNTRWMLAMGIFFLMASIVVILLIGSVWLASTCWVNARQCDLARSTFQILANAVNPMFTAIFGIFGSVVGFYFGVNSSQGRNNPLPPPPAPTASSETSY